MDQVSYLVVLKLLALGTYFIVSVLGIINFVGMHNNTVDGNSFRLLNPLSVFDASQFNDDGNRYRIALLKVALFSGLFTLFLLWAVPSAN